METLFNNGDKKMAIHTYIYNDEVYTFTDRTKIYAIIRGEDEEYQDVTFYMLYKNDMYCITGVIADALGLTTIGSQNLRIKNRIVTSCWGVKINYGISDTLIDFALKIGFTFKNCMPQWINYCHSL